jgi:hypothetical protein
MARMETRKLFIALNAVAFATSSARALDVAEPRGFLRRRHRSHVGGSRHQASADALARGDLCNRPPRPAPSAAEHSLDCNRRGATRPKVLREWRAPLLRSRAPQADRGNDSVACKQAIKEAQRAIVPMGFRPSTTPSRAEKSVGISPRMSKLALSATSLNLAAAKINILARE